MAFYSDESLKKFDSKLYLSSPTMHGDELKYMTRAFETNWMSTVGENINEVERIALQRMRALSMRSDSQHARRRCICALNEQVRSFTGRPTSWDTVRSRAELCSARI